MRKFLLIPFSLTSFFCFSQPNDALQFNGTNSYVQVPDDNAIDLSANFTLEVWVYPTGPGSDATQGGMILNKENSYEFARFADGSLQFAFSANGAGTDWTWTNTALILPQDQWSHIALIKNGTSIIILINGVPSYSDNSQPATLTANTYNLRFGTRSTGTPSFFAGEMEEVRIWNTARTMAEIKANMFNHNLSNSASGLVAYYRMNEGTGTTMGNSCTNTTGIDGTLVNSPAWVASPIQFAGNALNFDGTDDYVSIGSPLPGGSSYTKEAWVYYPGTGGVAENILSSMGSPFWISSGYLQAGNNAASADVIDPSTFPTNTWVHVAVSFDASTGAFNLYRNGNLVASNTVGGSSYTADNNYIGAYYNGSVVAFFDGSIDEVRIWNVARSQAQIQADMNTELDPSVQTGLVAYYTFDQGIASGTNTGLITLPDQIGNFNGTLANFALTGATSNFATQNGSLSILPLQWLSFVAQKRGSQTLLSWSTAEEINTKDFIIQRSVNSVTWSNIGTITAAGNDHQIRYYSYTDTDPANGVNYYRIEERDIDGRYTYSDIRSVNFETTGQAFVVANNPVVNGLLQVTVNKPARLSLYGYNGDLLWQKQVTPGTEMIDVSKFAKGIYLLRTTSLSRKIVVQ